mgnify:CR=1 FL=1
MKASMTAVLLFFVLGVSNGRSRFSSSEVNDVDVDAENVTSPGKFTDCEVTRTRLLLKTLSTRFKTFHVFSSFAKVSSNTMRTLGRKLTRREYHVTAETLTEKSKANSAVS